MLTCDQRKIGNPFQQLQLPYLLALNCNRFIDTFSTKMVTLITMDLLVSKFTAYVQECILVQERSLNATNNMGSAA